MAQRSRSTVHRIHGGFTVVELLVIIAITGILIGLLLPAIQQARETARRTQCKNNLKQVILAVQGYHDTYKVLPVGALSAGNGMAGRRHTWCAAILPYLDQGALYQSWNFDLGNCDPGNDFARRQVIPAFNCPADIHSGKVLADHRGGGNCHGKLAATSSYRAVAGAAHPTRAVNLSSYYYGEVLPDGTPLKRTHGMFHFAGTYGGYSALAVSLRDVTDGTSNTLAIGEYATLTVPQAAVMWSTYGHSEHGGDAVGTIHGDPRYLRNDYGACRQSTGDPNYSNNTAFPVGTTLSLGSADMCRYTFASNHVGGIQFAKADGSVSLISTSIDSNVLRNAATMDGGETLSQGL